MKRISQCLLLSTVAAALLAGAEGVPCTQDGFYYAVCPIQPETSNRRVVDGSNLSPLPDEHRADAEFDVTVQPTPRHAHAATASAQRRLPDRAASTVQSLQKNWRNYTAADWISIISIFLLALIVGVVFYLVNRTIQNERKKTAEAPPSGTCSASAQ